MKITIVGSGNIGLCLIGELSRLRKIEATLFCSRPTDIEPPISVEDLERQVTFQSGPFKRTNSVDEAFNDADLILCTYPAFLRPSFIKAISPKVKAGTSIGFFPAYGGAEFFCKDLLEKGCTIFGLQKVPYVARTCPDGITAGIWSRKKELYIGALPKRKVEYICTVIEDLLQIKCIPLSNYMQATLLPGNPLLHTCGSIHYLADYSEDMLFDEPVFYYREWNDECSETICAMSDEMQAICNALPVDLSLVKSIQEYYDSPTPKDLTTKFHSIPYFQDLLLPTIKTDDGYKPDLNSRFFTEDIPYGVATLKALGLLAEIETPTIDSILQWYKNVSGKEYFSNSGSFGKDISETAIPQLFGLDTAEKLALFYTA